MLLPINPPQLLADRFSKIEKNMLNFPYIAEFTTHHPRLSFPMLSIFSTVTEDQVTKIIMNSPSKSCSLDPWPTFLVLDYLDILNTPIASIINASLEQGKCPNFLSRPVLPQSSKYHP